MSSEIRRHTLEYSYCCIPVQRIEYDDPQVNKDLFKDRNDFYGKIVPRMEGSGLKTVKGMSGGPLLSIEKNGESLIYRLFGVQKSWDKENRVVRAESIAKILELIEWK